MALTGKHLIAGHWVSSDETFESAPVHGPKAVYCTATAAQVDQACQAAEEAFFSYGSSTRAERAAFLKAIADEIEARGAEITEIGTQETGLPVGRLQGERGRTTSQLRLFADHILAGDYLDRRHDAALPDRKPIPRPDLKMVQRPIGPVAVFGASNFPLAFSTGGGDTASALAAGCPVVVKGHPAHPGTTEIVAQAIAAAMKSIGIHLGTFNLIQGDTQDVGRALVLHPLIRAVGFTGSLGGGRALFDLCSNRPEPIPFFGELGSVNPMFVLPEALAARAPAIAEGWATSLTMGAGQFCTNPGVVVLVKGPDADAFVALAKSALEKTGSQTMLTNGIANAYRSGRNRIAASQSVREILTSGCEARSVAPDLFQTTGDAWLANAVLGHEVFGPLGLIVIAADFKQMQDIARGLTGQLTCTLQMDAADIAGANALVPVLERKAGRLLVNGFPTGVEVADAMVHGGPYPASTNFGHTSVGTMAIRRFLRPVCYQNFPDDLHSATILGG
ncbi:MAG TPA: aldehyde dehydrogenase (NADP(+)) [Paracoccaceae bacterium]|nr:aldehyde dehydrogenase (NADP(+)) [Paracoccaceae bacterium]